MLLLNLRYSSGRWNVSFTAFFCQEMKVEQKKDMR